MEDHWPSIIFKFSSPPTHHVFLSPPYNRPPSHPLPLSRPVIFLFSHSPAWLALLRPLALPFLLQVPTSPALAILSLLSPIFLCLCGQIHHFTSTTLVSPTRTTLSLSLSLSQSLLFLPRFPFSFCFSPETAETLHQHGGLGRFPMASSQGEQWHAMRRSSSLLPAVSSPASATPSPGAVAASSPESCGITGFCFCSFPIFTLFSSKLSILFSIFWILFCFVF